VVPPANAEFLEERLPNVQLVVVDAGHFVWEEQADEYASLIADWSRAGTARWRRCRDRGRDVTSNRRRWR
jgi:hypothetical protein